MCGIVAICGRGASRYASTVATMLECLSHRGPDDQGILLKEDVALGQKRLSIMDVAGGASADIYRRPAEVHHLQRGNL